MRRITLLSSLVVPVLFAWLLTVEPAVSQEAPKAAPPAVVLQPRGRLPAYFAAVVDKKQRGEIYRIQARIQDEVDRLRRKIAELQTASDHEVDAVLTSEQLAEVNKKRAAAEERRRARQNRPARESSSPPAG
jgi:hypothetical protein